MNVQPLASAPRCLTACQVNPAVTCGCGATWAVAQEWSGLAVEGMHYYPTLNPKPTTVVTLARKTFPEHVYATFVPVNFNGVNFRQGSALCSCDNAWPSAATPLQRLSVQP